VPLPPGGPWPMSVQTDQLKALSMRRSISLSVASPSLYIAHAARKPESFATGSSGVLTFDRCSTHLDPSSDLGHARPCSSRGVARYIADHHVRHGRLGNKPHELHDCDSLKGFAMNTCSWYLQFPPGLAELLGRIEMQCSRFARLSATAQDK
jgi:hypothetical protein